MKFDAHDFCAFHSSWWFTLSKQIYRVKITHFSIELRETFLWVFRNNLHKSSENFVKRRGPLFPLMIIFSVYSIKGQLNHAYLTFAFPMRKKNSSRILCINKTLTPFHRDSHDVWQMMSLVSFRMEHHVLLCWPCSMNLIVCSWSSFIDRPFPIPSHWFLNFKFRFAVMKRFLR